jgi:ribonuclease HI
MEAAVVIGGAAHVFRDLGHGDNSDAEWTALLAAVRLAVEMGADDVEFVGDSSLVVAQASGVGKCRSPVLAAHLAAYRAAVTAIPRVRVRYVPRSKNLAGIALAAGHSR